MKEYKLNMNPKAASVLSEADVRKQIHIMINDYMDSHLEIEEVKVEIARGTSIRYTFTIHDTSEKTLDNVNKYIHSIFDFESYAKKRDVISDCTVYFINPKEKKFNLVFTIKFI